MRCVLTGHDSTKIADTVSYCEMIVNDFYLNKYKDSYDSSALTK